MLRVQLLVLLLMRDRPYPMSFPDSLLSEKELRDCELWDTIRFYEKLMRMKNRPELFDSANTRPYVWTTSCDGGVFYCPYIPKGEDEDSSGLG